MLAAVNLQCHGVDSGDRLWAEDRPAKVELSVLDQLRSSVAQVPDDLVDADRFGQLSAVDRVGLSLRVVGVADR